MKDRLLMRRRPHLVVDGATLAAEAVGASDVVLYVGDQRSRAALAQALRERRERVRLHLLEAPARYVAGEESAAVHSVDEGVALPTTTPPRPFERGVAGRPTLVQNVETLAHAALVARHGGVTGCEAGRGASQGTVLLSVSGAVPARTVVEVAEGTTVGEAVTAAGGVVAAPGAVLLGGYFGTWRDAEAAWSLALDAAAPREFGGTLGCGVVAVLEGSRCGLAVTARIAAYLAGESAGQCGPCVFGLRAIAEALGRLAACAAAEDDVARLCRWVGELPGRGACRHPDGAAAMVRSALATFAADLVAHVEHRRCAVGPRVPCPA